jgi:hypothetical protein
MNSAFLVFDLIGRNAGLKGEGNRIVKGFRKPRAVRSASEEFTFNPWDNKPCFF